MRTSVVLQLSLFPIEKNVLNLGLWLHAAGPGVDSQLRTQLQLKVMLADWNKYAVSNGTKYEMNKNWQDELLLTPPRSGSEHLFTYKYQLERNCAELCWTGLCTAKLCWAEKSWLIYWDALGLCWHWVFLYCGIYNALHNHLELITDSIFADLWWRSSCSIFFTFYKVLMVTRYQLRSLVTRGIESFHK